MLEFFFIVFGGGRIIECNFFSITRLADVSIMDGPFSIVKEAQAFHSSKCLELFTI